MKLKKKQGLFAYNFHTYAPGGFSEAKLLAQKPAKQFRFAFHHNKLPILIRYVSLHQPKRTPKGSSYV